ncbi:MULTISPECIES: helix-turn-helix domain-containing protein [unclassified Mycobacterium]|uniref:TetR/AcrR family transcriptional regulator n=1 Tax=unclassified Mycobacterium TaxID=2642494 RepID=UPI0029C92C7F|nr:MULTISPECIES: helix-turn-helix domain-containing protein [unclassified Mycobacterium]
MTGEGWESRVVARSLGAAKKRSLDRSRAFIEAAVALLREKGHGFTLEEVSARAGFSQRLFYQHFGGKQDLLLAVLEEELRVATLDIRAEVNREPDPLRRLVRLLDLFLKGPREHVPHNLALISYELGLVTTHPQQVARAHAPEAELAGEVLAAGIEAGVLTLRSAEEGAYMVIALKRAYNHSRLVGNELGMMLPPPEELIRFCVEGLGAQLTEYAASTKEPITPGR